MTHSRHPSRSREPGRTLAPAPTAFIVRLFAHNLATTVSQFDLFSLLPPHVDPLAVDFNHGPTSVSARFSFHALDQALALWNHARELHAGGHLSHLQARGGSGIEPLWFDIDPPIERLVFNFEASKTIFRAVPRDINPIIHISNLSLTTSADAIRNLVPADLQPHVLKVHVHDMGPSLSPPFPEPDRTKRLVGRASVAFDSMQNAVSMFKQLQLMKHAGELNRFRHFGANAPFGLNPTYLHLLMQARAAVGDKALQALLSAAKHEPKLPIAPPHSARPTPVPSSSASSTRSKTPSPTRTLALPPPPSHRPPLRAPSASPPSSLASRSSPALSTGATIRRPPQPSPVELYSDPSRPFVPRHYIVCLENLSPHTPAAVFDSLAASFAGTPPFHMLVSHACFVIVLAFERVATRAVDYSFHSVQDAEGFVQHVRGMDKRGELDEWKAVRGCKVSVYQRTAEGSEVVGW